MLIPLDTLQPIDITNYRDERLANIKPSSFAKVVLLVMTYEDAYENINYNTNNDVY